MSDYGYREYNVLRTRLLGAKKATDVIAVASRITTFVQQEDTNPVYAETLVNMLMSQALEGFERLTFDNSISHDVLTVRQVTRHVNTTVRVWRRTMEHNASGSEG